MVIKKYDLFTGKTIIDIDSTKKKMNKLSLNYVGNKRKIVDWIYKSLEEEGIKLEDYNVFDAFTGSGSFSIFCKMIGCKKIVTNDLLKSSWVGHKALIETNEKLKQEDIDKLLEHKGIYKELLDWLQVNNYEWFKNTDEEKNKMIDYVKEKSIGNKYLEFMLNYVGKYFTLKECIELASFREYIDDLNE